MKVQRKLTDDELQKVMSARHGISQMCDWNETDRGCEYWRGVATQLTAMASHATTNGQPYVDVEPPIPDGYRLAAAGDEVRKDVEFWNCTKQKWCVRAVSGIREPFAESYYYIVPIDPPIPDGYRLAVAGDEGRRDVQYFGSHGWTVRAECLFGMAFQSQYQYIVPIDRVPTDTDAIALPIVMVRDRDDRPWEKRWLVRVNNGTHVCLSSTRRNFETWKYCRHLYPGE